MGASEIKPINPTEEIICPHCPLTPIISTFLNEEDILTTEYRCPNLHFGYIPFDDLFKNKNKHGNECSKCKKQIIFEQKKIKGKEQLLYCGTCKEYFCLNCKENHDKEKESHKIMVEKSRVNYTCLEHNKNFVGYCVSCLIDTCPDCKRHEQHLIKSFDELYSEFSLSDYQFRMETFGGYIKSFKRQVHYCPNLFEIFKIRNQKLLDFAKYLYENYELKKKAKQLNSEIILNLINVIDFDFNVDKNVKEREKEFQNYCKTHLILKYKPISFICTFSRNRQYFNLNRTQLVEYHSLVSLQEQPNYFKYCQTGELLIFSSGQNIYLLSTKTENKILEQINCDQKIMSFNILNKNILCICFQDSDMILYKLALKPPLYGKDEHLPKIESPSADVIIQIIGNFKNYIVTRTINGVINLHSDKKIEGEFDIVASDKITYSNGNDTNYYELKAIWKDYVIIKDNANIVVRDLTKPKLNVITKKNVFNLDKNRDFLVYNGNIMTFKSKEVLFYNIPNLEIVSKLELLDNIISINIVNPRTMMVVEGNYIEQIEVKTWKRLNNSINLLINKRLTDFCPIGGSNKLFFYNKKDHIIYYASPNKD